MSSCCPPHGLLTSASEWLGQDFHTDTHARTHNGWLVTSFGSPIWELGYDEWRLLGWGLVFDANESKLYLSHTMTADVTSFDEKTHETVSIPVGQIPCALALDSSAHRLYAVNYEDRTVSVIDTANAKVIDVVPVGDHRQAVAVDVKRNRVYVANVHSDSVTAIDTTKNAALGVFPVDEHPYAMALDPTTGRLYTAVYGSRAAVQVEKYGDHGSN